MMQSCANCKYGRFEMTKHRPLRIKDRYGICQFLIIDLVNELFAKLPECATSMHNCQRIADEADVHVIWTDMGQHCPVWDGKKHD